MIRILLLSVFLLIAAMPIMAADENASSKGEEQNTEVETVANGEGTADGNLLNRNLELDIVYGEEGAPIRIVEYASLSCPACRNFYMKVHKGVLEDYIEAGDVQFVYRHFPLNAPAFRAALLVECVENPDRKKLFLGALFKSQGEWANEQSEQGFNNKIKTIARIGGISDENYDLCITDKAVEDKILAMQLLAVKELNVKGTPAIFINEQLVPYSADIDEVMKRKVEALLANASQSSED